jgi:hypothetical protein
VKGKARALVTAHFLIVFSLVSTQAFAAPTPPSKAQAGKSCAIKGTEALSLKGALVCDGKKWSLIKPTKESIQSKAFRSVLARWNSQTDVNLSLAIYADPKAGNWTQQIESGIRAGAHFWGTSDSSSRKMPVIISDDHLYIEEILSKLGIPQSPEDKERNAKAEGGQAGFHGAWDDPSAYWDFLFRNNDSRNNAGFWQVPAHEYTHFAQSKLSLRNWSNAGGLKWMDEGIPSYIGAVLGPMSKMPNDIMNAWKQDLQNTQVTLEYFSTADNSVYSSPNWSNVYPMGAVASEGLVALVGIPALIQYYVDLASGSTLPDSFKRNFGITDTQMTKILSSYVQAAKSSKPWNLTKLETEYKKARSLNP